MSLSDDDGGGLSGDVAAACEWREWRLIGQGEALGDEWMELLTPEERSTLRTWIEEAEQRYDAERS